MTLPVRRNLSLESLRVFVAVVEERGFSRAAQVLSMSQPTVSLRMKRLEDLLGTRLLDRGGRSPAPTEAGEELLGYARQILRLNDEAVALLAGPTLSGHLRLGIPNEFAGSYLPRILGRFAREYPSLTLEVTCDLSNHLLARLQKHELDLAVAIHRTPVSAALDHWSEDLVWVAGASQEQEARRPLPLVAAPNGCVYRHRMVNTLRRDGTEWRIVYTGTSYNGIRAAVDAGLGVTVLAKSTVPEDLRIVGRGSGLPDLAPAHVAIHYDAEKPGAETRILADYIHSAVKN